MSELKAYNCHNSNAIFCTDDFYKVADVQPIFNSLQQLKAEIAAVAHDMETDSKKVCGIEVEYYINRLQQLSVV